MLQEEDEKQRPEARQERQKVLKKNMTDDKKGLAEPKQDGKDARLVAHYCLFALNR